MGTVVYSHRRPHKGTWTGAQGSATDGVVEGSQGSEGWKLEPGGGGPWMPQDLLPPGSELANLFWEWWQQLRLNLVPGSRDGRGWKHI